MPILGCRLPLRHDECEPVPTPAMADEYAALLVDTLINKDPPRNGLNVESLSNDSLLKVKTALRASFDR